jgi:TolB-like protein/class 3 adenylate cyclase/predicted Zn-dependent protease
VPDPERHLAAILSADVVGYSRLMARDEEATIRAVTARREEVELRVRQHRGRLSDFTGDNFLAEFASVVQALECAVEIQRAVAVLNADLPPDLKMEFRIGLHLGEIRVQDDRLFGTGVNVAARLESLAEPGGICISGEVHGEVESRLDLGYEDLGARSVKNIPKPVRVYRVRLDDGRPGTPKRAGRSWTRRRIATASAASLIVLAAAGLWLSWPESTGLVQDPAGLGDAPVHPPLPDEPSVVVLPFDNMSGDPEQEYFADGITEDLTTDLSRYPRLFVIARNTAFTYKGSPVRIEEVGRELGVRYAVEGSVRKVGDRVRITAQLIDATSGLHLWSERYDRELVDVFALQDEIVTAILDSAGVEIEEEERRRARRKPSEDLSAYDAFMRGQHHLGLMTRRSIREARRWFERAIELEPRYADAQAALGLTYLFEVQAAWDLSPGRLDRAEEHARRCLELDPLAPGCHLLLAGAMLIGGNAADAIPHAERALELRPSFWGGHMYLGLARVAEGQPQLGLPAIRRAIRLNPRGDVVEDTLAFAQLRAGRVREAVEILERSRAAAPDKIVPRILLASHYGSAGDHALARVLVEEIRAVNPDLTVEQIAKIQGVRGLGSEYVSAAQQNLRRAGLPDRIEAAPDTGAPKAPRRPGIAVLPFCNLSNDPEQEYFSDGVTEDLTAVLSRSPDLLVISRSSSSRYECQPPELKRVGRELGIRYVVEGSVRRAGNRVRITAQLIDADTDVHVWSDSYERVLSPTNVFEIQSDIASEVSSALQLRLFDWEGRRQVSDPNAWDLFIRARYLAGRISSQERLAEINALLERAIELDPEFAPAHGLLAFLYAGVHQYSGDPDLLDRAEAAARRSLALDSNDATGHLGLAAAYEHTGRLTDAIREANRAIELSPSLDSAHVILGLSQLKLGQREEARRSFDRVLLLNPRFPTAFFWVGRGTLHYLEGEIGQAIELWERARTVRGAVGTDRIMLAYYYQSTGRRDDTADLVREILSREPGLTAAGGVETVARVWNEEWIPEDLGDQLLSAGLP